MSCRFTLCSTYLKDISLERKNSLDTNFTWAYSSGVQLTTEQAAERLGVSRRRIQQLIASGRLPAQPVGKGKFYLVNERDLKRVEIRTPGRRPNAAKKKPA